MSWTTIKESEVARLTRLLNDNREKVTITNDGRVRLNLASKDVQKTIMDTVKQLHSIKLTEG